MSVDTRQLLRTRRRRRILVGAITTFGGFLMASGAALNWYRVVGHGAAVGLHKDISGAAGTPGLILLLVGIAFFFRGVFVWNSTSKRGVFGLGLFAFLDGIAVWMAVLALTHHIPYKLLLKGRVVLGKFLHAHHMPAAHIVSTIQKLWGIYVAVPAIVIVTVSLALAILWNRRTPRVEVAVKGEAGARQPLVKLTGVKKYFPITRGVLIQKRIGNVHAVDGVDLEIYPGETVGLVGETGCGKSTLARVVMRLYDPTDGTIWFDGQDVTALDGDDLRELRRNMQMIFQDPFASLNPRKTVGSIIGDPYRLHRTVPRGRIKDEVKQLMELVGLNPEHYNRYPHEFSGGQRQRIGVARSLALRPKLIVCDEPVSALDVSIQAQVLNLLEDLQEEFNLTYLFIAHDLSVVRHVSDRVAVMYLGRVVEMASGDSLYRNPKHPYTGALLSAVPIPDPDLAAHKRRIILEGDVPSPIDPPSGCRFHPRCPRAQFPMCQEVDPQLEPFHEGQVAACHFPLEDRAILEIGTSA